MTETTTLTQISDNTNHGYIAGRDLFLGDQYLVQETLYFEPDLSNVEPPAWTTTPKARELASSLARHRLIVLAGQDMDDYTMVARHVAWLLRHELAREVRVREWYRSSDPQKIETAFHESDTTILLLPQVQPHHMGHRLNGLTRLLHARRNYAIVTTDGSRADWGVQNGSPEEALWHEISWESYYGRSFLVDTLLLELASLNGRRPDWLPSDLSAEASIVNDLTVEETAIRLKQPDQIRRFAEWLQTDEASPRALLAQLDQLGGDRAAIFHWYRQLDRADQLLSLGLVLFDGLPDDQIFAALELLVNEAWRQSDPNLPLFDYKDLQRLSAHFKLAESGESGTHIEALSRQKREAILEAAWEFQRRRLLAVVPVITRLLQEISTLGVQPATSAGRNKTLTSWFRRLSPKPKEGESDREPELWRLTRGPQRELFSSPRRVEQLQRSIVEALSQIGILSFEAVEASFLELAVSGSAELQTIVAKALAAWRGEDHSKNLFPVLNAWWSDGCIATSAKSLIQKTLREGDDPRTEMRATVALTVGYALQYDPPNQLAPELLDLLKMLVRDQHPTVRSRVADLTLPLAVASHLRQLEPLLLHQITMEQGHLYAIAFGTAMAFSLRPSEAREITDGWQTFSRSLNHHEPGTLAVTPRERLLAVIALAYGYIRCDEVQETLSPEEIVNALRSILAAEINPYVRTHALMAMGLQAVENFSLVATTLMELISEITLADRLHVISVLTRAYLRHREQLDGGDDAIEIGGRTFQIWTRSSRPLTAIETALYSWLRDENHPVAQQVAIQTFAAIAATELDQQERALTSRRASEAAPTPPPVRPLAPNPQRLRRVGFLGRLAVAAVTIRRKEARPLLLPLLAEAVEVQRIERTRFFETVAASAGRAGHRVPPGEVRPLGRPLLPGLLTRWCASGEKEVQSLARSLSMALDFFRWRWAIVLTVPLACGLLVHDVTDWNRAFSSNFSAEEQHTIRQRSAAPLRLAWTLTTPEVRRIEEQRRKQEEEEARLALEVLAASDRSTSPPAEERVAEVSPIPKKADLPEEETKEEAPAIVLKPADRLLLSAARALAWLPDQDLRSWLLKARELQPAAEPELVAEQEAPVAPPPQIATTPSLEDTRGIRDDPDSRQQASSLPQDATPAISDTNPAEQSTELQEEATEDESFSLQERPRPVEPEDSAQSVSKPRRAWQKLKDRLTVFKRKPPTGEQP